MDSINFLKDLNQNYKQYNVEWPLWLSNNVLNQRDNKEGSLEDVIIYEEFGTVGIGTRSDFELFKKVNNDHDYRASDNNMLFCLNDKETIDRVIKIVVGYYLDGDYSYALERLIDLLEPKKKLDLKK